VTTIVDPTSRTITLHYDVNNRIDSITDPQSRVWSLSYTTGKLTQVTYPTVGGNSYNIQFGYDARYNDDNRRSDCTELSGDVVSYGYDSAGRLTSESRTGANSYSYSYVVDGVGNRTSQTKGGTTTTFTYSTDDELTATSGGFANSYSYNANGEQTNRTLSGTSHTLAYDYDGQLTSIVVGGNTTSFVYDGLGRRYSRAAGGTTTKFLYGPGGINLEVVGTTVTATYTHGNALLRKDSEYPMFDGLGSERTIRDGSQNSVGSITFEGFGATITSSGSSASAYMFAGTSGYRNDGDAGMSHVGARYHDAQVGRFVTRDTHLDQHPYLYCEHDPVNRVDPSGHDAGWAHRQTPNDPYGSPGLNNPHGYVDINISRNRRRVS